MHNDHRRTYWYVCTFAALLCACSSVLSGRSEPQPTEPAVAENPNPPNPAVPTSPVEPLPVGLALELRAEHSNITAEVINDGTELARIGSELRVSYSESGRDFTDARLGASWRTSCDSEAPSCIALHRGAGIVAPPIVSSETPGQCLPGVAAAHRLRAGHYRVSLLSCDGRTITEQSILVTPEAY